MKPILGNLVDFDDLINQGLILYYRMNEGMGDVVRDLSMNNNHGKLINMAHPGTKESGWGAGFRGSQIKLDEIDDYIDCGSGASFDFGTGSFTTSFWFKGQTTDWKRLIGKEGDANHSWTCYDSGFTNYKMSWSLRGNSTTIIAGTQPEIVFDNKWHHAVWVVDRTEEEVIWYFDGVKSSIVTDISALSGMNFDSTAPVRIGRSDIGRFTSCAFDEVRIYNRTLSGDEIINLNIQYQK